MYLNSQIYIMRAKYCFETSNGATSPLIASLQVTMETHSELLQVRTLVLVAAKERNSVFNLLMIFIG